MNPEILYILIVVLSAGCAHVNAEKVVVAAQNSQNAGSIRTTAKVDASVWEVARTKGVVWITISLNVPVREKILTREEEELQKRAVRVAQDRLLEELVGTKFKLRTRNDLVPIMSMEVGEDVLVILESSSYVVRVLDIGKARNPWENIIVHEK